MVVCFVCVLFFGGGVFWFFFVWVFFGVGFGFWFFWGCFGDFFSLCYSQPVLS